MLKFDTKWEKFTNCWDNAAQGRMTVKLRLIHTKVDALILTKAGFLNTHKFSLHSIFIIIWFLLWRSIK